jgi:hypothetical protein
MGEGLQFKLPRPLSGSRSLLYRGGVSLMHFNVLNYLVDMGYLPA